MNLLILSANTGAGHNSCARAVQQCLQAHGQTCVIEDGLSYISPAVSDFISRWHTRLYRYMPGLSKETYEYSEEHPERFKDTGHLYKLLTSGAERLRQRILEGGFDTVLCTHVFPALALTVAQKNDPLPIRTAFLATDYTCSPMVDKCDLDLFFIPDPGLIPEFAASGLPEEKQVATGIPVRRDFITATEKAEAKARCGIDPEKVHLLVMCGSMGCGPMRELVELLEMGMRKDMAMTVVCGTNESLYQKLRELPGGRGEVRLLQFTDQVSLLMDSADLYLTKPGGISTTEAAVKSLPMVLINAVSGCERYNLSYFTALGGAKTGAGVKALAQTALRLLSSPRELTQMRVCLSPVGERNAAEIIYTQMKKLVEQRENEDPASCC